MRIKDSHQVDVKSNGEYGMLISLIWTTIPGLGESSGPLFFAWQEKQLICVLTSFLDPCSETDSALLGRDGGHRHAGGVASRAGVQAVDEEGPTETQ